MLFSVGENDEGSAQVFGVATRLLLGVVRVEVRPFGFQDAERAAFSGEDIIRTTAVTVEFEADATVVQEIPAALSKRLVNQDAGKCLGFGRQTSASARDYSDTPSKSVGVNAKRERPATTRAGGARYIVPLQNEGKDGEMATPVLRASCADF